MAILTTDQQTKGTIGTNRGIIWTRDALVPIAVQRTIMCQHAQLTNFSLEDEDASEVDHEDLIRGVIANFGARDVSFATWKVILNQIVRNSGMQWQTSSIQGMRKLYQE